ncbi:hypothetical protein BDR03DRAFT_968434 [Suillus americanus]|nr:hypothetical protein BDR03DRAFT_968434 [Suillus americanus]
MDEGRVAITSRRLFIMVIALIAPELMITWATRNAFIIRRPTTHGNGRVALESTSTQFFIPLEAAGDFDDSDTFNAHSATTHSDERDISENPLAATSVSEVSEASISLGALGYAKFGRWTITHGFFAWMGGFMLHVNGNPRATLTPNELLEFVRKGSVDLPVITEAEIEDRSKGDGLSKGIAILQLLWFVAQLVARYIQNLPITLLEIDTLAVAALTCISYALWWKKPKDVGCPYIVHLKATATLPGRLAYEDFLDDDSSSFNGSRPSESYYVRIRRYIAYPFICLMGIRAKPSAHAAHSRRVPSLGGYDSNDVLDYGRGGPSGALIRYRIGKIILLIGCFSGMVFGGIHCLAHIMARNLPRGNMCTGIYFA